VSFNFQIYPPNLFFGFFSANAVWLEELITVLDVSDENLICELQQNDTHLYLSAEPGLKVQEAQSQGIAAAIMKSPENIKTNGEDQLRVVFDGDAVLFSHESERINNRDGLQAFLNNEREKVEIPMKEGPFKSFLEDLERLKMKLQVKAPDEPCPIRTYLVTSRDGGCGGYRALNSLRTWGLMVDVAVFLGGTEKGPTLKRIRPNIFFDDQQSHIKAALKVGTVACLVEGRGQKKTNGKVKRNVYTLSY
uniref:5'-nucleotidase, cytosolic IA n=1 Tax=Acanthochromis polyacanthus TaxID=80966 RepID=A0A3Q1G9F8_9TELE